jgi:hypothetical protein
MSTRPPCWVHSGPRAIGEGDGAVSAVVGDADVGAGARRVVEVLAGAEEEGVCTVVGDVTGTVVEGGGVAAAVPLSPAVSPPQPAAAAKANRAAAHRTRGLVTDLRRRPYPHLFPASP